MGVVAVMAIIVIIGTYITSRKTEFLSGQQDKQGSAAFNQQALAKAEIVQAQSQYFEMVSMPGENYEIGKYEVTQSQWREVMGNNPSSYSNCGDTCPVDSVSWDDIQIFLQKLNARSGKQYRLPTEAEWE